MMISSVRRDARLIPLEGPKAAIVAEPPDPDKFDSTKLTGRKGKPG